MKRIFAIMILLFIVTSYLAPFWGNNLKEKSKENIKEEYYYSIKPITSHTMLANTIGEKLDVYINKKISKTPTLAPILLEPETKPKVTNNPQTDKIKEAQNRIKKLDKNDKMEWFKNYKLIQKEYEEYIDIEQSIYDVYSENELALLFSIVETEVRGDTYFCEKANVASVIFNRIENDIFPNTLYDVLTQKNQFSSYSSNAYKNVEVNETTIIACEYAFQIEDTTKGALWFDSTNGNSWASKNRTYIFTDNVGHTFYK